MGKNISAWCSPLTPTVLCSSESPWAVFVGRLILLLKRANLKMARKPAAKSPLETGSPGALFPSRTTAGLASLRASRVMVFQKLTFSMRLRRAAVR